MLLLIRMTGDAESAIWTAQDLRVEGGMQALAIAAARELGERVRLDAPVRAIEVTGEAVRVHLDGGRKLAARHVVVALPPTLAGRLVYVPALPGTRDQLCQRMANGAVIKVIAVYERPFWREAGLSGLALNTDGPVNWIYDNCWPDSDPGMLVGFVTGHAATRLVGMEATERRHRVLSCFAAAFGGQALDTRDYVEFAWAEEEYSRGCYAGYGPPGFWTSVGSELREPAGPIHWAGTETATNWMSFIEGAICAGERSAREVLSAVSA
jgi:monoamine oxidase